MRGVVAVAVLGEGLAGLDKLRTTHTHPSLQKKRFRSER